MMDWIKLFIYLIIMVLTAVISGMITILICDAFNLSDEISISLAVIAILASVYGVYKKVGTYLGLN